MPRYQVSAQVRQCYVALQFIKKAVKSLRVFTDPNHMNLVISMIDYHLHEQEIEWTFHFLCLCCSLSIALMVLFREAQHGVCLQENFAKQRQSRSKLCWSIQFIYMEDLRRKKKNTIKYSEISSWHSFMEVVSQQRMISQLSTFVVATLKASGFQRGLIKLPSSGQKHHCKFSFAKWSTMKCSAHREQYCPCFTAEKSGSSTLLSVGVQDVPCQHLAAFQTCVSHNS